MDFFMVQFVVYFLAATVATMGVGVKANSGPVSSGLSTFWIGVIAVVIVLVVVAIVLFCLWFFGFFKKSPKDTRKRDLERSTAFKTKEASVSSGFSSNRARMLATGSSSLSSSTASSAFSKVGFFKGTPSNVVPSSAMPSNAVTSKLASKVAMDPHESLRQEDKLGLPEPYLFQQVEGNGILAERKIHLEGAFGLLKYSRDQEEDVPTDGAEGEGKVQPKTAYLDLDLHRDQFGGPKGQ